jgi:hypothetical protein
MDTVVIAPQVSSPYVVKTSDGAACVIETSEQAAYVVLAATQGPPGVAGPPGGGVSTQTYTAAGTISAYLVVAVSGGEAVTADSSQIAYAGNVVGVAIGGVNAGALVTVQFAGQLEYNGWNWTLGKPIFLGTGGMLTQTPPASGFNQIIGTPVTPTSIFINLQSPTLVS